MKQFIHGEFVFYSPNCFLCYSKKKTLIILEVSFLSQF